jgi:hypothetical protein
VDRGAALLAVALLAAGCSTNAPATVQPGGTSSALGGTGAVSATASAPGPARTALPPSETPAVSPLPTDVSSPAPAASPAAPDAGGWATVLPALPIGAAYLDFGFAGNGDLLVVGTDDVTKIPATVWIGRYATDGTRKGKAVVARKMQAFFGADYIEIDQHDDSVLFTQIDFSVGLYHVYKVASATGTVLERLDLHKAMNAIAATPDGRIYGISATYGTWTDHRPCIVDRVGSGGGIATGVDYDLETCETIAHFTEPFYFEDPMAIDAGTDGNLLVLDWGEAGKRLGKEPAGLGVAVLTPGFDFVRRWHLPSAWQVDPKYFGIPAQGTFLSGDHAGNVYIDQQLKSADLSKGLGFRLGVFDTAGNLLATYGFGGDHAGLTSPIAARVDDHDNVWVIDFDPAAKGWVVKRLEDRPWE